MVKYRQRGGNFKGKKHQRSKPTKTQDGGGIGMALGMLAPLVLGAASKILPGVFGKKAPVTNNYQQQRPQTQPQRPPPLYYQPPPQQYYRPPPTATCPTTTL